jgi:hypothetical protein
MALPADVHAQLLIVRNHLRNGQVQMADDLIVQMLSAPPAPSPHAVGTSSTAVLAAASHVASRDHLQVINDIFNVLANLLGNGPALVALIQEFEQAISPPPPPPAA